MGSLSSTVQYDDVAHYQVNSTCNYYQGWVDWFEQALSPNTTTSIDSNSTTNGTTTGTTTGTKLANAPCVRYNFIDETKAFAAEPSLTYYWYWQVCNEFGYLQTSTRGTSRWSVSQDAVPAEFYAAMCVEIFGDQFALAEIEKKVVETNADLGGNTHFDVRVVIGCGGTPTTYSYLDNQRALPQRLGGPLAPTERTRGSLLHRRQSRVGPGSLLPH